MPHNLTQAGDDDIHRTEVAMAPAVIAEDVTARVVITPVNMELLGKNMETPTTKATICMLEKKTPNS